MASKNGFVVRGQNGAVQIDGENFCMCLQKVNNLSLKAGTKAVTGDVYTSATTSFVKSANSSLVALRCSSWCRAYVGDQTKNLNEVTIARNYDNSGTPSCIAYEYGNAAYNWSSSKSGIEVFNSSKTKVFSSNWSVMRVFGVYYLDHIKSWSLQLPVGRTFAMVLDGGQMDSNIVGYNSYTAVYMGRIVNNKAEVAFIQDSIFHSPVNVGTYNYPCQLMVMILEIVGV
ncbi:MULTISPECIES: hypothetical protein [Providencia]|uniref:hypothetical protein n=1 Tax=Providencia TaxID=586 RepID=UPI00234A5572